MPYFDGPTTNTLVQGDVQEFPYLGSACETLYAGSTSVFGLPVAAPVANAFAGMGEIATRAPMAVAQTAAPFGSKAVYWAVSRRGKMPKVPHPDPQDANQVLQNWYVMVVNPAIWDDALTKVYEVRGVYVYLLQVPVWALDGLGMGVMPFLTDVKEYVTPDLFVQDVQGNPRQGYQLQGGGFNWQGP